MKNPSDSDPVFSDILEKTNIGLWAIELEESKAPRMYVNDTMLGLLGLSERVSPEETYCAWHDRIDEDSLWLVSQTVKKLISGIHAETQYSWHHPDGRVLLVRCGGMRDDSYTEGVRLEGTHQNISELDHFDGEDEKQGLILLITAALSDEYTTMYFVDAETGGYRSVSKNSEYRNNVESRIDYAQNFFEDCKNNISRVIYPEDIHALDVLTDRDRMAAVFAESDSYTADYRLQIDGELVWYRVKAVKIIDYGRAKYAVGVSRIEQNLRLQQRLAESLTFSSLTLSSYDSAFYIELSTCRMKTIKLTERVADKYIMAEDYRVILRQYVDTDVHPDDREAFYPLLNPEEIRARLADRQSFSFTFRLIVDGQERFSRCEVIHGSDNDHVAFGYSYITKDIYENQKRLLGAIPLSSDILTKANIGLWAFELDEGSAPRMYVDDAMLELIGLEHQVSPEETYHAWYDHIDTSSYGVVADSVMKMSAGEHAEVQYPWHFPDGRTMIVRCGGVRNYNYTGGIRIEGTHQNVTEVLHFREEKMAEQDVINRYILNSYESLYYVGLEDQVWEIYKRPKALENNYPPEEHYLSAMSRYIETNIHPEDRETASILVHSEELKKRLAEYPIFNFVFRKIGEEKVLLCEVVRGADENHVVLGYKDITAEELRQKEQDVAVDLANQQRHIKAFGDMINAALWSMDIDDDDNIAAVYWSDEFRHKFGFENTEDFPNTVEAWSSRLHPEDRERALHDFYDGIRSRDTESFIYDIKYRILQKSGEYRWYHAVGRMEYTDRETRRMYGVITDISADIKLEEQNAALQTQRAQLEEALSMAQSASRAKTTFLNNMSHDIRTPMNAIIGYAGLAASHLDNRAQVQDYLSKISQSSDHLLSLINDVLDMSRIESGKMNLCEKEENLSEIIHTLRNIVQGDIISKQLDFYMDAVDVKDEYIVCDRLRLNQILLNILSNAIKYTGSGGTVALRVTERAVKPNGYATFEFRIKDTGMGMTPEFLKTVYEPFTRGKSSTISGIPGTGLGMAISKNIIDMMGGTIGITSEPGKGTEVTITFDFKLQNLPKQSIVIPELKGVRALVADDDSNTCISIAKMVRDIGMRDEWCTSGKEAVIRSQEAHHIGDAFKVYIIDWLMPDMNGIETTRRIRKVIGDDAPIIILTAYDWSDIEDEAREAGVTAFVSKPMFPSDFHKVIMNCMGGGECKREEAPKTVSDFTGKRVLLVEDNEINREIASEIMTEVGFDVDTAEDGSVAVEVMKSAKPGTYDLILMDIQMPVMDGFEATKAIRLLPGGNEVKIIALSANAFQEDRQMSISAGMNAHVAKPIDVPELLDVIGKLLSQ